MKLTEEKTRNIAIVLLAVGLTLYQIYTASTTPLPAVIHRSIHVGVASMLVFLIYPCKTRFLRYTDWVLAGLNIVIFGYTAYYVTEIALRMGLPTKMDVIFGVIAIVLVIEGTRRAIGPALPIITVLFLAYAFFGYLVPGAFTHKGFGIERIVTTLYLTTEGIFGIAISVSATFVAVFVIFGAIFQASGGGKFFIDFAQALVGHVRGGPAKVAVISSALFGTISGSVIGNVATTGTFTIPLMKSTGYKPEFAAGVEATASTGGMITPPVMGAAAFVMAEILQMPYYQVALAAFVPAMLYYISIFFSIDYRTSAMGLRGISRDKFGKTTFQVLQRDWPYLAVLVMLVYMIAVIKVTPMKAGIWSMWTALVVSLIMSLLRHSWVHWRTWLDALEQAGRTIALVALPCACCGIIIGVFTLTGMGLKLSSILVEVSGGHLFLMLILSAISCIILGMAGLITPAYIMLAIMVAPAMASLGANDVASHLFLVHFTSFADITPPVALAAYVAAGIAGANAFKASLHAIRLVLPAFIIPFLFVYHPELILQGSFLTCSLCILTAIIGVILFTSGIQGYFLTESSIWQRVCFILSAAALIYPGILTDILGVVIALPAIIVQFLQLRGNSLKPVGGDGGPC